MHKKVDYIVVGLGLAGIAFVEQLISNNKTFVVFENQSQQSSLVAGGTYNPVILKRFTPVWNGHKQLVKAIPFYKDLAEKLQITIDTKFTTKKIFTSIADENNWFTALDKPMLSKYMKPTIHKEKIPNVIGNFGYGELEGTGRIDTGKLLASYKKYLKDLGLLVEEAFAYDKLDTTAMVYKSIETSKIVFAEGYGLKQNPFFNYLPLNGTKGETMVINAPNLEIDFLLKSSVFVLPLEKNNYLVGATFNWTDKTSIPTEEGKKELLEKLEKVINVPFTIVTQKAGIRPTVKDRRPLVGTHPKYANLAVLNGLGTRGVMIAPTVAEALYTHIENNTVLDTEINITRFKELLS